MRKIVFTLLILLFGTVQAEKKWFDPDDPNVNRQFPVHETPAQVENNKIISEPNKYEHDVYPKK